MISFCSVLVDLWIQIAWFLWIDVWPLCPPPFLLFLVSLGRVWHFIVGYNMKVFLWSSQRYTLAITCWWSLFISYEFSLIELSMLSSILFHKIKRYLLKRGTASSYPKAPEIIWNQLKGLKTNWLKLLSNTKPLKKYLLSPKTSHIVFF